MKKLVLISVIIVFIFAIYNGYFRNIASLRLCSAVLIAIFLIRAFHVLYNYIILTPKTYGIFVSHSWSYSNAYENFINLLKDAHFPFRDASVPKEHPIHNAPNSAQLYQAIKEKMAPCHIVIVMAGVYATYSTWINNEIYIAKHEFDVPKPVLAISPWGARRISDEVRQQADMVVKWNTESIISAIKKLVN